MPEHGTNEINPGITADLERYFDFQRVSDEVFGERKAQDAQWGDGIPPTGPIIEALRALSRDELIQALAAGVKLVLDHDKKDEADAPAV